MNIPEEFMVKNMGKADRILRIAAALVVGILILSGQIVGTTAVVLGFLALVFIATSAIGTCPLYIPFKFSTKKK